jgi:type IV pilus assembly protein PilN
MIKINLNPKKKEKINLQQLSFPELSNLLSNPYVIGTVIGSLIFLEIGYMFYLDLKKNRLLEKKQHLIAEKERLKKIEKKIKDLKMSIKYQKDISEKIKLEGKIYKKLAQQKDDFRPMIAQIGTSLPDGVWLKTVNLDRKKTKITGYSFNPNFISYYYENLSKYYKDVSFSSTKRENLKRKKSNPVSYYSFSLVMSGWKSPSNSEDKN